MDNYYYTSVTLCEELKEWKTLACGTVRSDRSGLPKEICGLKDKKVKQLKRGGSLFRQKGSVTCVTWRDQKPVRVLATTPTSKTDQTVVQRSVEVNGTWEKRDFARPGVINLYNTYMGGVDLSDQRAVSYADSWGEWSGILRFSFTWLKCVFQMPTFCTVNPLTMPAFPVLTSGSQCLRHC